MTSAQKSRYLIIMLAVSMQHPVLISGAVLIAACYHVLAVRIVASSVLILEALPIAACRRFWLCALPVVFTNCASGIVK